MNIDDMRKQLDSLRRNIQDFDAKERIAANKSLIGRFFKYRNCYSCPTKPSDYWWMYTAVIGVDRGGYLKTFVFQRDSYGAVRIEQGSGIDGNLLGSPIRRNDFEIAWKRLQRTANAMRAAAP